MCRFMMCFMAGLACLLGAAEVKAADLALPASGVKAPYSPLAVPTRMAPLEDSLEALLNRQYHVVAAHQAGGEEVLVLYRVEKFARADSTVICALTMPVPEKDQTVVTSRCWSLNRPGKK